ncbi:DNA topoisomerase 2-beta [Tyrophagus putrescentiae]|nr:DNA topoisomerase 2-beta [Tyrophagus putrescentiae]
MFARNAIKVLGKSYGALAIGGLFPNPHKKNGGGKALEALISVLGLDFECQYEIAEESASLNYQQVLLGFDADPDGTANAGRVISLIALHWPALLSNGFVTLLRTPTVDPVNGSPTLSLGSIQPATAAKFYGEVKAQNAKLQFDELQMQQPVLLMLLGKLQSHANCAF